MVRMLLILTLYWGSFVCHGWISFAQASPIPPDLPINASQPTSSISSSISTPSTPSVTSALKPIQLEPIQLQSIETLPIQAGGRKKPFLVFAQESLQRVAGTQTITKDQHARDALSVITGIWLNSSQWQEVSLINISNRFIKEAGGLPVQQQFFSYRFLNQQAGFLSWLQQAAQRARMLPPKKQTAHDRQVLALVNRLHEVQTLFDGSAFRVFPGQAQTSTLSSSHALNPSWTVLPPEDLQALKQAYSSNNQIAFNTRVLKIRQQIAILAPSALSWTLTLETLYQKLHPFRWAWIFYVISLLTGMGLFLGLRVFRFQNRQFFEKLYLLAWGWAGIGFFLQGVGLLCRILIAGRPPVTNMYESILWVAFGCVGLALYFEAQYRSRYFLGIALSLGAFSLILSDLQPADLGSSIHPLMPVLQSQFWLSTHVLIITLSYAAFLLASGIAHLILIRGLLGKPPVILLSSTLYRTLQMGIFLLATGILLGAVWANYSWGRFWDWDPKETWALVALLTYLFVLHGAVAGKWTAFSLAVGAIVGFLTILMAWYGVNFVLGSGLHSYGFGTGGLLYVLVFLGIELGFLGCAVWRRVKNQRH